MTPPSPHRPSKHAISHFPPHAQPRVWFITAAASPIAISLSRELLAHGDIILAGNDSISLGKEDPIRANELGLLSEDAEREGWGERFRIVNLVSRCEAPSISVVFLFLFFYY